MRKNKDGKAALIHLGSCGSACTWCLATVMPCILALFVCRDLNAFQRFVGGIKAQGGKDTAEDVLGGLKVALKEITWRRGGTKVSGYTK